MTSLLPAPAPTGEGVRVVTLLHWFPGLRSDMIARALRLSPLVVSETLVLLLKLGLVRSSSERFLGGYASTGIWDPDHEPTRSGTQPDWPYEHPPLRYPGEGLLL